MNELVQHLITEISSHFSHVFGTGKFGNHFSAFETTSKCLPEVCPCSTTSAGGCLKWQLVARNSLENLLVEHDVNRRVGLPAAGSGADQHGGCSRAEASSST